MPFEYYYDHDSTNAIYLHTLKVLKECNIDPADVHEVEFLGDFVIVYWRDSSSEVATIRKPSYNPFKSNNSIKLRIENLFQRFSNEYSERTVRSLSVLYDTNCYLMLNPYDEDKWRDNKVYEFLTLKEVYDFINTCDISFNTPICDELFEKYEFQKIDITYTIDPSYDNLLVLKIGSHAECYDLG